MILRNSLTILNFGSFKDSCLPIRSRSQPSTFSSQTTYWIELSVYSVNAKPIKRYFYIDWKGPFEMDLSSFENNISVYESDGHPVSFRYENIGDAQPDAVT